MKRALALFIAMCPVLAVAANVFIWNYDPLDRFYDNTIGDSVDCSYWVEQTLDANGHTYTKGTLLPSDLSAYDAVFALLGWYRC